MTSYDRRFLVTGVLAVCSLMAVAAPAAVAASGTYVETRMRTRAVDGGIGDLILRHWFQGTRIRLEGAIHASAEGQEQRIAMGVTVGDWLTGDGWHALPDDSVFSPIKVRPFVGADAESLAALLKEQSREWRRSHRVETVLLDSGTVIAGYPTRHYRVTVRPISGDSAAGVFTQVQEYWMAEVPILDSLRLAFEHMGGPLAAPLLLMPWVPPGAFLSDMGSELEKLPPGFPLRTVQWAPGDSEPKEMIIDMEVVRLGSESRPDSWFIPPPHLVREP